MFVSSKFAVGILDKGEFVEISVRAVHSLADGKLELEIPYSETADCDVALLERLRGHKGPVLVFVWTKEGTRVRRVSLKPKGNSEVRLLGLERRVVTPTEAAYTVVMNTQATYELADFDSSSEEVPEFLRGRFG